MSDNLREFDVVLREFGEKDIPDAVRDFRDALTLEALRGVVQLTPVDRGRLRGNWQVGIAVPPEGHDPDRLDPAGGPTIEAGAAVLATASNAGGNPYSVAWIHNGVPYGPYVNDGVAPYTMENGNTHPGQPAVHMVEQTVERISRRFG